MDISRSRTFKIFPENLSLEEEMLLFRLIVMTTFKLKMMKIHSHSLYLILLHFLLLKYIFISESIFLLQIIFTG